VSAGGPGQEDGGSCLYEEATASACSDTGTTPPGHGRHRLCCLRRRQPRVAGGSPRTITAVAVCVCNESPLGHRTKRTSRFLIVGFALLARAGGRSAPPEGRPLDGAPAWRTPPRPRPHGPGRRHALRTMTPRAPRSSRRPTSAKDGLRVRTSATDAPPQVDLAAPGPASRSFRPRPIRTLTAAQTARSGRPHSAPLRPSLRPCPGWKIPAHPAAGARGSPPAAVARHPRSPWPRPGRPWTPRPESGTPRS
jgi:hypothetical protein